MDMIQGEGQSEAGFLVGIHRELNVVQRISAQQCEEDINELKEQLDEKDKQLTALKTRVKNLEERNIDLESQLKSKCDEVKSLKERITKLENEKSTLEEELSTVKLTLKTIKDEVRGLSMSKDAQEATNVELEGKLRKISITLKDVQEELQTSQDQNKQLKQEIQHVKKQHRYVQGTTPLRLPVPVNEQDKAMKSLREMACHILNVLYMIVLPEFFTPIINYSVDILEQDIHNLPKTAEDKNKALEKWNDLKKELSWTDQQAEVLHLLQNSRSPSEIPGQDLDENVLKRYTEFLHHENVLRGRLEYDSINRLIEVWKKLNKLPSNQNSSTLFEH